MSRLAERERREGKRRGGEREGGKGKGREEGREGKRTEGNRRIAYSLTLVCIITFSSTLCFLRKAELLSAPKLQKKG